MKIHRFCFKAIDDKWTETSERELCHQINSVLKLRPGELVKFTDGLGGEATICLDFVSAKKISGKVIDFVKEEKNPQAGTVLAAAILKKENFELVVQKASEMGVSKIIPILTDRTVKMGLNFNRLQRINIEALELSGSRWLTDISLPQTFADLLQQNKDFSGAKIVLDPVGQRPDKMFSNEKGKLVVVGPEGGFTETELQLARENNFQVLSLGENVWRGETAGIVAGFILTSFLFAN